MAAWTVGSWSNLSEFLVRLSSRKFLLAVVAGAVAFGNSFWNWGLTTEEVWQILVPLLAFVGIEGARDWQRER